MISIVVEDVRYAGKYGGAVFSGRCSLNKRHRYIADYKVMPRPPVKGEVWRLGATVQNHTKYGLQYVSSKAILERPSGRLIIKAITNSHLFPGIREKTADKLFRRFGEKIYGMLDTGDPKLFEKPLKSKQLARVLINGWRELATEADVYQWLYRNGSPVWLARKVVDLYGDDAVVKLEDNPYRLQALADWEVADEIARARGINHYDDRRLVAAIDEVVANRLKNKHTWTKKGKFKQLIKDFLKCDLETAEKAFKLALNDNAIVEIGGGIQGIGAASMEKYITSMIRVMTNGNYQSVQQSLRIDPTDSFMESFFKDYNTKSNIELNTEQRAAVKMALKEPVSIICGGVGVGKTTALQATCAANDLLEGRIHMVALSGTAAKQMSEATGRKAMTIANFLNKIEKNEIVLLDSEAIIAINAANMIDLPTMYRLLRRFEPGCRLLMIGDPGQSPPISFGAVFHTLVQHKTVPMVELTEIHKQAATTGIPQTSKSIRNGEVPSFKNYEGKSIGIQFITADREDISAKLIEIIDNLGGFDDARILSPVKNGAGGTKEINVTFHYEFAFNKVPELHGFGEGELVIWTENDYDLDLINSSLGKIIKASNTGLVINWDTGVQLIDDLKKMDHAYAITISESQGSQFKRCVIPVFKNKRLDRTMLYTAVTRAEKQVVLIGDPEALEEAITNPPSTSLRETGLHFYLENTNLCSLLPC